MKQRKMHRVIAATLSVVVLFSSCSSTTMIQSIPSGAKVFIDGEVAGTTPYRLTDTKIVGSSTEIELQMENYQNFYTTISRTEQADVGAIVAGLFLFVPFLWTMGYKPTHTYQLNPLNEVEQYYAPIPVKQEKSTMDKLLELKEMLDKGLINEKEYETLKKRVLEE